MTTHRVSMHRTSCYESPRITSIEIGKFRVIIISLKCCLDEEIGLVCWQLVHDMHATEIFGIQPSCKLSYFL